MIINFDKLKSPKGNFLKSDDIDDLIAENNNGTCLSNSMIFDMDGKNVNVSYKNHIEGIENKSYNIEISSIAVDKKEIKLNPYLVKSFKKVIKNNL